MERKFSNKVAGNREAINRKFQKISEEKHIEIKIWVYLTGSSSFPEIPDDACNIAEFFLQFNPEFFVKWKAPDLLTIPEEKLHPLTCMDRNTLTEGFNKRTYLKNNI